MEYDLFVISPTEVAKNGRPKRASTLSDVAIVAGVNPMTVSRAINRSGYVSEAVRERVLAAAKKLHYRPNLIARQLRGGSLNAIGVILPDIANPFSAELMQGINEVMNEAGFVCFIGTASQSGEQERSAMQAMVDHRIDGLVVATHNTQIGDTAIEMIADQGVPVVTIGRPLKVKSVDCVVADDWQGAFDVTTHLVKQGHRRIGFLGCNVDNGQKLRRFLGFQAALKEAGLSLNPEHAIGDVSEPGYATESAGFHGMMTLAKMNRRPTAVFARNDFAAIGALRAANVLKLRVPRDIAIAGFDNISQAAFQTPPLTTAEQPIAEQGRAAARLLLKRIRSNTDAPGKTLRMKCSLVVRESTDPRARESSTVK